MKRLFYIGLLGLLAFNVPAGILVQFRTTFGDIDVELYEDKPVTVQNFLRYVKSGSYQNMFLHRCIPGFIVQGGGYGVIDPQSQSPFSTNNNVFSVHSFGAITNEFNVGRRLTNSFGTIAMAKLGGDPNSATSQWFFNLGNNSTNLDFQNGGFTVFGRTVHGTNILNIFNTMDKSTACGIEDMTWWLGTANSFAPIFSDLPVIYCGLGQPFYGDLIYVYDISLLNVQVQTLSNATHQISWNRIAGQTNYTVQFTTNLSPTSVTNSWQTLVSTNGTNATLKIIDPISNSPRRFYRVRADY